MSRLDELRAELRAAEEAEQRERDERRKSVKPVLAFTFTPVKAEQRSWLEIRANSGVRAFNLTGRVTNVDALKAAGWTLDRGHDDPSGSMVYLVNFATPTPRIIKADGGGRIFIPDGRFGNEREADKARGECIIAGLEVFLQDFPNGGDVTYLFTE